MAKKNHTTEIVELEAQKLLDRVQNHVVEEGNTTIDPLPSHPDLTVTHTLIIENVKGLEAQREEVRASIMKYQTTLAQIEGALTALYHLLKQ